MATYAPNGISTNDDTAYSFSSGRSANRYHLTRLLRKRGMKNVNEILKTLLDDATPASTASVTVAQIDSVATPGGTNSQGGVRGVTSNEIINSSLVSATSNTAATARAVVAGDVTELQKDLYGGTYANRAPGTYPTDASGNGGGGKLS
jgi:hypothetical protein